MLRTAVPLVLLLAALPSLAQAQEKKPIVFEVLLPASATLVIDGYKTISRGESRLFETPDVEVGKSYSYTLKANDGAKLVVKTIILKTTGNTKLVVDLRKDFTPPMPSPMPKDGDGTKPKVEKPGGTSKRGFVTFGGDAGPLWIFREGSRELASFVKDGELEKHVSRVQGGPQGKTIKAADYDTIEAYMKALPK